MYEARAAAPAADLEAFGLHHERGFLPHQDPLRRLPTPFDYWEEAAACLPKLLVSDRVRELLAKLPPFPVSLLHHEAMDRRAMLLLSYLGHAYVWGQREPVHQLPAFLARPWHHVASKLGRPPVLSYASYALDNWYRLEQSGPIACGNIALIQNFLGGIDEEWFILIHVEIEAKAAAVIREVPEAQRALYAEDEAALATSLAKIEKGLEAMYDSLARMPEHCDPYVYYHRVRPYIHGWKNNPALPEGLVYEGVEEYAGKPQAFRGETGAQSSIIPTLDALLGVFHEEDILKTYLLEMREYMPPKHRGFMEAVEAGPPMREFLKNCSKKTVALYDACVGWVERFRTLHLQYAATYIFKQHQTDPSNPAKVGTGGTPFMKYLKKHRDETTKHALG
ncbi:MAG TPA: hypothetical protein VM328_00300 [Fimbriimonadaceae bacterium]|nr:hypothetical protein [Fimbriimonadaceae bacterium]